MDVDVLKCPVCGSKLKEGECYLYDAASNEILKAKEYKCNKCGFVRVVQPI